MPDSAADGPPETRPPPETGYAAVNGLQMYYGVHGSGGTPLVLLHGGLFNIDLQFGELLPSPAASRQVIAADFQGHGRTNDIDRPLTCADLASDVIGLLQHLGWRRQTSSGSASAAAWLCTWRYGTPSWSAS
jgi:pimeloyl-ACP methyl ester carboxylesterase